MSEDINLIARRKKIDLGGPKAVQILRMVAIVLLFLTATSSIALFLLKITSPLSSLERGEKQLLSQVSENKETLVTFLLTKARIKDVQALLSKRKTYDERLKLIADQIPAGVFINSLVLSEKTVLLSGQAGQSSNVDAFLSNITDQAQKKTFSKITLNSLVFDPKTAKYSFSLAISMP